MALVAGARWERSLPNDVDRGTMTQTWSTTQLVRTAARCETLEELAHALLTWLAEFDVDVAAVWSRFGQGRWHRIAATGPAPDEPPEEQADWQLVSVGSERRTTVLGLRPDVLGEPWDKLVGEVLQGGLRRLEAEAIADSATQAGEQRLATILDATPDAVVVVDLDGVVIHANVRATELFGHAINELVGAPLERLIPSELRERHRSHREAYMSAPTPRSMAAGQDLHALHRDGSEVPVDIALEPLEIEGRTTVAAFVRDATARRRAEQHRQRLATAEMAQKQALELNDNVVQGLTSAIWSLEMGEPTNGLDAVRSTLRSAREMMADLLQEEHAHVEPGMLQRATPARSSGLSPASSGLEAPSPPRSAPPGMGEQRNGRIRVVLADDSADLRFLLKLRLQHAGMELVAAAEDGRVALQAVDEHQPDVVIMDLSMPVLDGLQASAMLRERYPHLSIVVLSGHPPEAMIDEAMAAGADAYVQKGSDFDELIGTIHAQVASSSQ